MSRGPGGELLVSVKVLYDGIDVFGGKLKQLNVGKTGVQLQIGKDEAAAAGIPSGPAGICKVKGVNAGTFERNISAFNKAGKKVELATFEIDDDGDKTVEPCSAAALASVVRLGPALKGQGADTRAKVEALERFSITLASAPAAAKEKDEEEGDEDEEEVDEAEEEVDEDEKEVDEDEA
jgi:hypothetical protein